LRDALSYEDTDHDDTKGYDFEPVQVIGSTPCHASSSPFGSPLSSATDSLEESRPPSPLALSSRLSTGGKMGKTGNSSQKKMRKLRSKRARQLRRERERLNAPYGAYQVRPRAKTHHILKAKEVRTDLITRKLRVTKTGWTGSRDTKEQEDRQYSLDELVGEGSEFGFKVETWDGM
jgi:hypothetical protein